MSHNSAHPADNGAPILVVPYMWIGDFVRCHSVVRVLRERFPERPVDVLTTTLCAPLLDYMPGVRKGIEWNLVRKKLNLPDHRALAGVLRSEGYRDALIMPRTWKAALAPYLAGIPVRTGFVGEMRFGLLNDARWGERKLPRMVDRCCALALADGAPRPAEWPVPQIEVTESEARQWRIARGVPDNGRPVVAFAPGAVGWSKRWPVAHYAELARMLVDAGLSIWVLGSPNESVFATEIVRAAGPHAHDLTSTDLRNAILALRAAKAVVSNDSGLVHVAAAIGTPTIGIFGPTSPWHWAPLNPLAGVVETLTDVPCRPCHKPECRFNHHRCMVEIPASQVLPLVHGAVGRIAAST